MKAASHQMQVVTSNPHRGGAVKWIGDLNLPLTVVEILPQQLDGRLSAVRFFGRHVEVIDED